MSRNRWMLKLWTATAMVAMIAGFSVRVPAQTIPVPKSGAGGEGTGIVNDWSHHHVVFSNPGTEQEAIQKGPQAHARWLRVTSDPRYLMQAKIRSTEDRSTSETPAGSASSNPTTDTALAISKTPSPAKTLPLRAYSPIKRDWSLSLGSGFVAANMSPAKFDFDGGATTLTSTNCTEDFVVYGLNVAGSASQANLVGVDNLYSGTSPTGLCGTVPTVKYAYNVTTLTGGTVTTSPTLSYDGTMVAFIESTGSATVLHVLRWKDSDGTVAVPATDLVGAPSAFACTAPCMTSLTLGSAGTTISSPFYDFGGDTLYVGNDAGQLFVVTGVFTGTPAIAKTVTVVSGGTVKLSAPVLDFVSGNVFVGGSDGNLYAITPSSTLSHIAVGSGGTGGGIVDGPLLDETTEMVTAFTEANATNVGGTTLTANTQAVAVQADATTPLGSPRAATLGQGTLGSTGSLNMVDGTFDNSYYNYGGTGANTGYLYAIGTAPAPASPTVYQIPFSGIKSLTLTTPGAHYTSPAVSIIDSTGSGASAVVTGSVDSVTVGTPGSGYTTALPTPSFTAAPAGGTTATGTSLVGVTGATVSAPGSGYTALPTVNLNGTGTAGVATALMNISSINLTGNGVGYTGVPTVTTSGGSPTTAATLAATVATSTVTVATPGAGYLSFPTVTFPFNGTGTNGTGAALLGANAVTVTAGGSGYLAPPTVSFSAGSGGNAAGTALLGVLSVGMTAAGSYTSFPGVTFTAAPSGGTTASGTALVGLNTINATGGSFTSLPTFTITGSGTGGGAITPTMAVSTVGLMGGGSGYTAPPLVNFAGTGSPNAVATASMGVNTVTVSNAGTGYTGVPTVGLGAGGATATAYLGAVSYNIVTNTGSTTLTSVANTPTIPTATVPNPTLSGNPTSTASATPIYTISNIVIGGNNGASCSNRGSTQVTITGGVAGTADTLTYTSTSSGGGSVTITNFTSNGRTYSNASPPTIPTLGSCSTQPTFTFTLKLNAVNAGTVGSGYSGATTAISFSVTPSATVTVDAVFGVSSVAVTAAGSGYASNPTPSFSGTGAGTGTVATSDLKVVGITVTTNGAYTTFPTASFSGGIAVIGATTVTLLSAAVSNAGSYSGPSLPTVTSTSGTVSLGSVKVVGVTVTPGSGYITVPTVGFTGTGSGATGTASLEVVGVNITAAGSYSTAFPTINTTGGATLAVTCKVVGFTVSTAGTSTGLPTVSVTGGGATTNATGTVATVTVFSVAVSAPGAGYTALPSVAFTTSGSTTPATATALMGVSGINVTSAGSYSSFPTITFTPVGGGSGATAGAVVDVLGVTLTNSGGSGYTTSPSVTFSGTGGSGAAGTSTISVSFLTFIYGGGGYTSPTVTVTDTGTPTTTAVVTFVLNPVFAMTAGTPLVNRSVVGTAAVQASPITEIFTNASTDLMFYGFGNASSGSLVSQDITGGGAIPAPGASFTVPSALGGTSAIVVDNIATQAQASSIYFSTLALSGGSTATFTVAYVCQNSAANPPTCTSTSGNSTNVVFAGSSGEALPAAFTAGKQVTVTGLTACTQFNGTFTIASTGTELTSYHYFEITAASGNCDTSTISPQSATATVTITPSTFDAVKLTQAGLN